MSKLEDFIVEIGTEELPPKEQNKLASIFAEYLKTYFAEAGLSFGEAKSFATPRRIAVLIKELATQQPEQTITKRGPAIAAAYNTDGTPTKAALGFASSCGVSMQELTKQETDKGAWLFFEQKAAGQKTISLLPEMVSKALTQLPIKKPMRWGSGEFSFVRPVHWILMLLGKEIVKANIFGLNASNHTLGHRVYCINPIKISTPDSYEGQLEREGQVIAAFETRKAVIKKAIIELAYKTDCKPIINEDLLDTVTGLVEHPVALLALFDPEFLRVPMECLTSSMQDHQKSFGLIDNNTGKLAPKFIFISNLTSSDPQTVIRGNELVMHARLADAAFYYDKDQQQTLESRVEQLKTVVYQKKLGSLYDKTLHIKELSTYIATAIDADIEVTKRAAFLCKADLLTNMVYEFPELQGIMGWYYSQKEEKPAVANAIRDHYKPKFAQDELPASSEGIAIAIADRIDSLVGFFGIAMIPTGDKDPYGLRRQALAVLRILIEKNINLDLQDLFAHAVKNYDGKISDTTPELLIFCFERLKSYLAENVPAKTFAAVMATNPTKPLDFYRRLMAVVEFQKLEAATSLAAANKRVQNLLEKNPANNASINNSLIATNDEKELLTAIENKERELQPLQKISDYSAILKSLATLQIPVDNFFTNVMVMVEDEKLRNNRLNLLQRLRNLFLQVADVSLL